MEKFSDKLINLNNVSKKILKYGLFVVLISLIVSNILIRKADTVNSLNIAHEFASGSVYTVCEVVIGAIMMDMFIIEEDKKGDKKNDR